MAQNYNLIKLVNKKLLTEEAFEYAISICKSSIFYYTTGNDTPLDECLLEGGVLKEETIIIDLNS